MWQRLFDALIFCCSKGFNWDDVYCWNVDEFAEVYHALQRNETRDFLKQFSCLQTAFGADKKGVKEFIKANSVWLPKQERMGGVKKVDDFLGLLKSGVKLKK